MSLYYLASPYSHPDATVREARARDVRRYAAALLNAGFVVFSPIAMTHDIAIDNALPYEFEFWDRFNRAFIERSTGIIVADMDGWRTSRGVTHELVIARELDIPVSFATFDAAGSIIITRQGRAAA